MHLVTRVHWETNRRTKMTSTTKLGSKIQVGDKIYVGLPFRVATVLEFKPHPGWPALPDYTGRVAVTDRGSITVIDQVVTQVPA